MQNADYDHALRQALRAAADAIVPSADGLDRIMARLPRRRFAVASRLRGAFRLSRAEFPSVRR
jgi:nitrous oxidase accessory protein NosD